MNTAIKALGLLSIFIGVVVSGSEPGEIPLNSPSGPVGGEGTDNIHWYQQESLNGERYVLDPPKMPQPLICNEDAPYLSCAGNNMRGDRQLYEFAGLVYVMVYIEVDERIDEPWRFALRQMRQANRVFQRSGVPVQFLVTEIKVVDNEGRSMQGILNSLQGRTEGISRRTGADLTVALLPARFGLWSHCGLANVGKLRRWPMASVTACYSTVRNTLSHELGHSFGLYHDRARNGDPFVETGHGYIAPSGRGTIMSYAESRVPFFSSPKLKYRGVVYGDEQTDAVSALRDALGNVAMAHETLMEMSSSADAQGSTMVEETAYCD